MKEMQESDSTKYVLGFMFDLKLQHVALIEKNRPAWQAGKLNGVGGKVEPNETLEFAMVREFVEETGISTVPEGWNHFAELHGPDWKVAVYCGQSDRIHQARATTDEKVVIAHVMNIQEMHTIANVRWLVPMAQDFLNYYIDSPQQVLAQYTK